MCLAFCFLDFSLQDFVAALLFLPSASRWSLRWSSPVVVPSFLLGMGIPGTGERRFRMANKIIFAAYHDYFRLALGGQMPSCHFTCLGALLQRSDPCPYCLHLWHCTAKFDLLNCCQTMAKLKRDSILRSFLISSSIFTFLLVSWCNFTIFMCFDTSV